MTASTASTASAAFLVGNSNGFFFSDAADGDLVIGPTNRVAGQRMLLGGMRCALSAASIASNVLTVNRTLTLSNAGGATSLYSVGGNVGVGTSAPRVELDVVGGVSASGAVDAGVALRTAGATRIDAEGNLACADIVASGGISAQGGISANGGISTNGGMVAKGPVVSGGLGTLGPTLVLSYGRYYDVAVGGVYNATSAPPEPGNPSLHYFIVVGALLNNPDASSSSSGSSDAEVVAWSRARLILRCCETPGSTSNGGAVKLQVVEYDDAGGGGQTTWRAVTRVFDYGVNMGAIASARGYTTVVTPWFSLSPPVNVTCRTSIGVRVVSMAGHVQSMRFGATHVQYGGGAPAPL